MPRPLKADVPRTTYVRLRLTPGEAATYKAAASAQSACLSDWARGAIEAGAGVATQRSRAAPRAAPQRRPSCAVDGELLRAITGGLNNLNQLAKAVHIQRLANQQLNEIALLEELVAIQEILHRAIPMPKWALKIKGE
ncbi:MULTISPECIES: hypothetical protein [unclassified Variovorax]|uniref:hypothetical protein n=1 Tax=unclassified Variovorax TaxID=663243 RepID=UPI0034E8C8D8